MTIEENLRARPVLVMTPTMMPARQQRGVRAQVTHQDRKQDRPEDGVGGRVAPDHEHDDRNQRREVEAIAHQQLAHRQVEFRIDGAQVVLARVDLGHNQQAEIVEAGGNDRHPHDVEVGHLEVLGDQEGSCTQHRRRQDGAETTRSQQAARCGLAVARLAHDRPGYRADGDRGGHARARRAAQQERRQDDGATSGVGLALHG